MKRLFTLLSFLLILAGLNGPLSAQPAYYNYNTNGSNNSFPWGIAAGKEVQLLFLPGEFNQPSPAPAGNIISVAFRVADTYPITNVTYTNLTIALGQTALTAFAAGAYYSGSLTTVYTRASVVLNGAGGTWVTLTLDTPFPYDPTQSLVMDVGLCAGTGATGFPSCFTTVTDVRRNWSVGGCPFAYSSQNNVIYHWGLNIQTSGPPIVTTTAAGNVTSTTAVLNGTVNPNGASTAVTFKYGLTAAYGSTIAGTPSPLTGNSVNPVSASVTGLLPGNTYHYCASGTNSNGTTNGNDMTFTTAPILPVVTTVAANPVFGSMATINGSINAGGAVTTASFEYGTTIAYGQTAAGVPASIPGNTTTSFNANLTGLSLSTLYHFRAKGVNSVGTVYGADMTFTTLNCNSPGNPGVINGAANGCANSVGNVYSVAPITNATGYAWTVPPGAVITNGPNTNTITVTFGSASGNVTVTGTSGACGSGPTSTLAVTVNPVPVPTITGQSNLCVNTGYFDYYTQAGQTNYTWVISSGGTIAYGAGTYHVTVTWTGSGAQTISVNYSTGAGCAAANPTVLNVTVNPVPAAPGNITGPGSVCAGATGISYSVGTVAYATSYVWTLPTGATIASGAGTNSITVNFGSAVSGNILVAANNVCGNGPNSPSFPVTVNLVPGTAGAITGQAAVCQGDNSSYYITAVPTATGYTWSLPPGATITSGDNTTFIEVNFGATASSGNISVVPTNACGNGTASPNFAVTVAVTPPAPVITLTGSVLSSNASAGNQWYKNLTLIPGATSQSITPTEYGLYSDKVTLSSCSSDMSNIIYYFPTGIGENNTSGLIVYPNPSNGVFTVEIPTTITGNYDIRVFDALGLKTMELKNLNGILPKTIDLRPVAEGVYLIELQNSSTHLVKRIVVN
ncbi:MAG: T9SS type A sorting domain-containing protein [Bacteroidota bacterium]|jgi:PKD-like domain/Secretion system C-terminal sorting domain